MYADDNVTTEEITSTLKEFFDDFKGAELFWKHKNIILWLRERDMNSKFFYNLTKQRRARN